MTKSLFSQYYLDQRLADLPEWAEDLRAEFDAAQALWQRARQYGATWRPHSTPASTICST